MDSWQSVKPTSTLSVCLKLCKKENPRCWGPSNSLVTDAWTNWKARYKTPDFLSFLHTIPNISASFLIILFIHKIVLNCDDYFAYDVEIYEMKCIYMKYFPGGGVPGYAGEQWSGGLRPGGAERDWSVLLRTNCKAAACQVHSAAIIDQIIYHIPEFTSNVLIFCLLLSDNV